MRRICYAKKEYKKRIAAKHPSVQVCDATQAQSVFQQLAAKRSPLIDISGLVTIKQSSKISIGFLTI